MPRRIAPRTITLDRPLPTLRLVGANEQLPVGSQTTTVTLTQEQFNELLAAARQNSANPETWHDTFVRVGTRAGAVTLQAVVAGAVSGIVGGAVAVGVNQVMHHVLTPPGIVPLRGHRFFQGAHNAARELNPPAPWMEPIPDPAPPPGPFDSLPGQVAQGSFAIIGATVGTVVGGPVGTAVGGLIGGLVGSVWNELF